MFRTVLALSLALLSCGPNLAASEDGELEVSEGADALETEVKANVPSLTVWVKPALVPEVRDGRQVYVLRGRTSQNLEGINAYVFDDAFGSANVLSARTFEVVFDAQSELNSLAAGIRMFLAVHPQSASVQPATASLTFAPTFTRPTGTTSLSVRPAVQSCLDALSSNDSEACGAWYPVTRCVLPWRGVQLFDTPDDVTALVNATASINAQLPAGKSVAWRGYGTQDVLRAVDLPRVINGWKAREPYGDLVNTGSITATALKNELTAFGNAQALIPATQQVVYQQSFVAQRFERNGGKTKLYLLFFASAARVTVLETNAP
ncbi:MAG: hypothetical protein DI536_27095 [Archangium gephyra]|uniref:Uncharacterized protein n=1 Tax=Archangium gephyra TaxID=48 RepID=A0A2W5SXN2_9BACT|nr:MAG: hypothetical protein DI536_27095 [Archangium gephyra]